MRCILLLLPLVGPVWMWIASRLDLRMTTGRRTRWFEQVLLFCAQEKEEIHTFNVVLRESSARCAFSMVFLFLANTESRESIYGAPGRRHGRVREKLCWWLYKEWYFWAFHLTVGAGGRALFSCFLFRWLAACETCVVEISVVIH